jgi:hypothetical protein
MIEFAGLFAYMWAVTLLVCLTSLWALRQGRLNSTLRLCYEVGLVLLGVIWALQYATRSATDFNFAGWMLAPFFPVPYWIMVWERAIYAKLRQSSGCLAFVVALMFFSLYVEVPAGLVLRFRPPYNQIFGFLVVLILYLPPLLGLAARLNVIRHRHRIAETDSTMQAGQMTEAERVQDTNGRESD